MTERVELPSLAYMHRLAVFVVTSVLGFADARAEPGPRYIAAEVGAVIGPFEVIGGAVLIEGAFPVSTWFSFHARGSLGSIGDQYGGGSDKRFAIGLESQRCVSGGWLCGSASADVGVIASQWRDDGDFPGIREPDRRNVGPSVGPRLAIDAGGKQLCFRLAGYVELAYNVVAEPDGSRGVKATAGIDAGYRF